LFALGFLELVASSVLIRLMCWQFWLVNRKIDAQDASDYLPRGPTTAGRGGRADQTPENVTYIGSGHVVSGSVNSDVALNDNSLRFTHSREEIRAFFIKKCIVR